MRQCCRHNCLLLVVFALLCLPLAGLAQNTAGAAREKAYAAMRAGNWSDALSQMEKAVVENPQELQLQYDLGVIYFSLGRLDEAETIFEVLLRQDEAKFAKAYFDLANIAQRRGKNAAALEWLSKARTVDPGRADLESGIIYQRLEDYGKAIASFQKAKRERPDLTFSGTVHEAASLSQLKKFDESKKALESLLKTDLKPEQREQVKKLIARLAVTERSEKRWHVSGITGFLYDTNLLLNPLLPAASGQPSNEDDFAQVSSITGRYDLLKNDKWVLGAGYNHYNLTYFEHGNSSIIASRPSLYGSWNSPPFFAGMEYVYGHYWAGDISRADVHSLYPVFGLQTGERWRTEIRGWADWRDFHDGAPDDRIYGGGVIEYYLLLNGLAHVRGGVLMEADNTSPRDAGSYTDTQFTIGTSWPVWKDTWFLDVSGFFIQRNFTFNPAYGSGQNRKDLEQDLYVTLHGPITENMQIYFIFQRVWSDSNLERIDSNVSYDPFHFRRAIFSCMLAFEF